MYTPPGIPIYDPYDLGHPHGPQCRCEPPSVYKRAAAQILDARSGPVGHQDLGAAVVLSLAALVVGKLDDMTDGLTPERAEAYAGMFRQGAEAYMKSAGELSEDSTVVANAMVDFATTILGAIAKSNEKEKSVPPQYGQYPAPYGPTVTSADYLDNPYMAPEVKIGRIVMDHGADPTAWPEKARTVYEAIVATVKAEREAMEAALIAAARAAGIPPTPFSSAA